MVVDASNLKVLGSQMVNLRLFHGFPGAQGPCPKPELLAASLVLEMLTQQQEMQISTWFAYDLHIFIYEYL